MDDMCDNPVDDEDEEADDNLDYESDVSDN